jgi:hypothetical protein
MMAFAAFSAFSCASASLAPPTTVSDASGRERSAARAALEPSELARAATWIYQTPAGCPGRARFFEQLARRLPPLSMDEAQDALGPRVDIGVHDGDDGWLGRVVFQGAGGPVSREVTGADCEEVVVALALITSLWLRPEDAPRSPPRGVASAPAAAMRAAGVSTSPSLEAPGSRAGEPAPRAAERRASPTEPGTIEAVAAVVPAAAPDGPIDTSSALAAGDDGSEPSPARLQIAGLLAYASEPAGALAARLQLERWGSASVSSWSTSLGVAYGVGQHENDRLGPATLQLLHGQLELCPPGLDLWGAGWLRACAHGRAGALHFSADTERVPNARSLWRPWAALGAGLHVGVPLASSLSLRLLGEVSLVVLRDEFATERPPASGAPSPADVFTFYEISPVSFDVGIGAAHVF